MKANWIIVAIAAGVAVLVATHGIAQEKPASAPEAAAQVVDPMKDLESRVKDLEKRVQALERFNAAERRPGPSANSLSRPRDYVVRTVDYTSLRGFGGTYKVAMDDLVTRKVRVIRLDAQGFTPDAVRREVYRLRAEEKAAEEKRPKLRLPRRR